MTGLSNSSGPSHFLDIDDLSPMEVLAILDRASEYKKAVRVDSDHTDLSGKTLAMVFQKPSTRTRVSFETGMTQLGGHAIFLGQDDIQLGRGEPLKDTARTLSRYVDAIMARVFNHENVEVLAEYSSVPVINGLTDDAHPCQTLADLLTIREQFGGFSDIAVTWIGDGNNVAQSFVLGCALTDIDLTVITPPEHGIDNAIIERAESIGTAPTVTTDPTEGIAGTDVVYTDVWVSMGQEDERDARIRRFDGFQVNPDLLELAGNPYVMHCLPAHRGEEITDAVIESDSALIFEQAENRLHAQKALLSTLMQQS